jgi:hypothetical protein
MAEVKIIPKHPDLDVVAMLEGCLDRARNGEVHGIVVIQSFNNNSTNHCWAGVKDNAVRITGELMVAVTSLAGCIDGAR